MNNHKITSKSRKETSQSLSLRTMSESERRHPKWPFLTILVSIILAFLVLLVGSISWLDTLNISSAWQHDHGEKENGLAIRKQSPLYFETLFGDTLIPTPWQALHSHEGRQAYRLKRIHQILNCSSLQRSSSDEVNSTKENHYSSLPNGQSRTRPKFMMKQCPMYFHWIQRDFAPWKKLGVTRANLDMAETMRPSLKAVILKGKLYIDLHYSCYQTRVSFNVWGLLMLLRKYKGQVPDVEFLFHCEDYPLINKREGDKLRYTNRALSPPLLFSYCSNNEHYDIPWPDWSFWGWPELQLESWDKELRKITGTSGQMEWRQKTPKAYWAGNPYVGSQVRMDLIECKNMTSKVDINIRNWRKELPAFKENSKLQDNCKHRYMIYVDGATWSVSLKYIMACGSPTFVVSPGYYDFFMRGLEPWIHYVSLSPKETCPTLLCPLIEREIKFAEVNPFDAIKIGKAGKRFIEKEVGMQFVYDYMFHVLLQYSKLQRFQPVIPQNAKLVTEDYMLCLATPIQRVLFEQSRRLVPQTVGPCDMPNIPKGGIDSLNFHWVAKKHKHKVGWIPWLRTWFDPNSDPNSREVLCNG